MSNINNSFTSNKDGKTSKLIIISKDRIESAKEKRNYLTLKEGDLKLTIEMKNSHINKKNINHEINNIRQEILINSKSYTSLYDKRNLYKYYARKNILISPNKQIGILNKKNSKNDNIYIETTRSYNLLKTNENNRDNHQEDEKKLETILPNDNNRNNSKKNIIIIKEESKNNLEEKNNNENNKNNAIDVMNIDVKDDNIIDNSNNDNNCNDKETEEIEAGLISRNYFNNIKYNNINENKIDKYKSEEIKQINSNYSRDKMYVKNNNFIDKKNQRSDKAAKSISEQEADKTKVVSKLILDSVRTNYGDNNKENNTGQRLVTEYDYQYINEIEKNKDDDLISESKNSNKTIKIIENEENKENNNEKNKIEENNIIYNDDYHKINSLYYKVYNSNSNLDEKENEKKDKNNKIETIKNEFSKDNKLNNINNFKQNHTLQARKNRNETIYKLCSICDHASPVSRLFVAECNKHFLCRKCSKNYYEDIIEEGIKEMLCPFTKCREPVDLLDLKKIVSNNHFDILINKKVNLEETQNKYYLTKIKTNIDNENVKLYTKKHVIDINSNKSLYSSYNAKDNYCPNCFHESLFSKTNTYFFKCLYCGCKRCKYCLKEYDDRHFDSTSITHCKIYYRFDEIGKKDPKFLYILLLQLFFVFASYYICFAGAFLSAKKMFFCIFQANVKKNIILYLFAYLFAIICFVIFIPFIIIIYPYFPSIMALSDY